MKIRMKADVSGSRNGELWPPRGGTLELPDEEGASLCAAGIAEPVSEDKVEKAVPDDNSEKRLTTETASSVTPGATEKKESEPAPAKKAAAKRAPAKPAESK